MSAFAQTAAKCALAGPYSAGEGFHVSGRDGRIHSKNGVESDRERAYADGYRTRRGRGHGPMGVCRIHHNVQSDSLSRGRQTDTGEGITEVIVATAQLPLMGTWSCNLQHRFLLLRV